MDITGLTDLLNRAGASFEVIRQSEPILTLADAAKYFPLEQAAAALVAQTDKGLTALLISLKYGRIDFSKLKETFGFQKMKMADKKVILSETGYEAGAIPLVGLTLPCIMDRQLFRYDHVYGGTGNTHFTLKIAPKDIEKLNHVIGYI